MMTGQFVAWLKMEMRLYRKLLSKPDLILLDIEMPKLDGLSACRLIRAKVPTSEILILTVHQSLDLARSAAESGAWGYVSKSSIPRDLIPAIEAMMSPRR